MGQKNGKQISPSIAIWLWQKPHPPASAQCHSYHLRVTEMSLRISCHRSSLPSQHQICSNWQTQNGLGLWHQLLVAEWTSQLGYMSQHRKPMLAPTEGPWSSWSAPQCSSVCHLHLPECYWPLWVPHLWYQFWGLEGLSVVWSCKDHKRVSFCIFGLPNLQPHHSNRQWFGTVWRE